jgi:uncharacterized membrane protein YphA (DoxX/SURF4 family)
VHIFLRVFIGIVFLCAASFRILNPAAGFLELERLALPSFLYYVIIALELLLGLLLLSGRLVRQAAAAGALLLVLAIAVAFAAHFKEILASLGELCVFDPTPTDILLHAIYIAMLLVLVFNLRRKSQ